jgi:hypothetical protein
MLGNRNTYSLATPPLKGQMLEALKFQHVLNLLVPLANHYHYFIFEVILLLLLTPQAPKKH